VSIDLESIEMFGVAMKRREYLANHPLGKVRAIQDEGFVLWETPARSSDRGSIHLGKFRYLLNRPCKFKDAPAAELNTDPSMAICIVRPLQEIVEGGGQTDY